VLLCKSTLAGLEILVVVAVLVVAAGDVTDERQRHAMQIRRCPLRRQSDGVAEAPD